MWTQLARRLVRDAELFAQTVVKESPDALQKSRALARLRSYQAEPHQRPLECPYCWVVAGTKSVLKPVPGPSEAINCPGCGSEYLLEE
jgi:hypothetical protein